MDYWVWLGARKGEDPLANGEGPMEDGRGASARRGQGEDVNRLLSHGYSCRPEPVRVSLKPRALDSACSVYAEGQA